MKPPNFYHRIRFWYDGQLITFSFHHPYRATFVFMKRFLYAEMIDQGLIVAKVYGVRFFINKKAVYAYSTTLNFPASPPSTQAFAVRRAGADNVAAINDEQPT